MTGVFHVSLCTLKARGEVGAGDLTNICNCDKFDTSQRKRVHWCIIYMSVLLSFCKVNIYI